MTALGRTIGRALVLMPRPPRLPPGAPWPLFACEVFAIVERSVHVGTFRSGYQLARVRLDAARSELIEVAVERLYREDDGAPVADEATLEDDDEAASCPEAPACAPEPPPTDGGAIDAAAGRSRGLGATAGR